MYQLFLAYEQQVEDFSLVLPDTTGELTQTFEDEATGITFDHLPYSRLVAAYADGRTETLLDTTEDLWKPVIFFVAVVSIGLVLVTAVIVLKMRHI